MGADLTPPPHRRFCRDAARRSGTAFSPPRAGQVKAMAPSTLRWQERDCAGSQRHCCHIPDHKRCSFLRTAQGKYATLLKPHVRDLHRSVLLKNTILHLQDPRRGGQEARLRLAAPRGGPPWQETSQGPPAKSKGALSLSRQPTEDPASAVGNGQAGAMGVWRSMWAPPAFSSPCQDVGQVTGEGGLLDSLLDSIVCTAGEVLNFWESLQQQEVGSGPCLSLPGPQTDSTLPSESAAASPVQEAGAWTALGPEEPSDDPLFGSLEILASSYLSDIPTEDFFADIDMSEFENILWGSPSNEEPIMASMTGQADTANALQAEEPPLPGQDGEPWPLRASCGAPSPFLKGSTLDPSDFKGLPSLKLMGQFTTSSESKGAVGLAALNQPAC